MAPQTDLPAPAPDWHRIGLELSAARAAARREKRRFGSVSECTSARLREVLSRASALLTIDDARTTRP